MKKYPALALFRPCSRSLAGFVFLLFWPLTFLFFSCSTDAYDKGEGKYSLMVAEMADIQVGSDRMAVSAQTDEGERLVFAKPFSISWFTTADTVYRAVLYYNKVETGVEAVGVNKVGVLIPQKIDTMKTDPVRLESVWLSTTKRYLNAGFYVMVGNSENESLKQSIGMSVDTLIVHEDGKRTVGLTLYHDQAGMPEYYSQRTFVSVPLDSLKVDTVSLSIDTYSGAVVKKFSLR